MDVASRSRSFVAFAGITAALVVVDRAALRGQIRYDVVDPAPEPAQTGPPAPRQPDAVVIEAARKTIAQDIDPKLPKATFEAWLRSVVGAQPAMTWEVNDCGEQTGNPALDRGRDFPMCVEIHVPLAPKRDLYLSLLMGTFAKGLGSGKPAFHHGSLNTPDGKSQDVRAPSDLPALLVKKKPTPGVGFLAQRGKRTPGASLKSGSIARLIARISSMPASP